MGVIDTLVAVIPMLGILIVVHELGHFLVAKACGVRVLKFSIGFGAPIGVGRLRLRWERNGTEYVIGWIPLGGFVRMLGEPLPGDEVQGPPVPEDARPDEFLDAKPAWQKLAVVFAGPAMNLLLPVLCLMGVLWVGLPRPAAVVGSVEAGSPAARAGLEPGDRIVSMDGEPVEWWDEVALAIDERSAGGSLAIEIERAGEHDASTCPSASSAPGIASARSSTTAGSGSDTIRLAPGRADGGQPRGSGGAAFGGPRRRDRGRRRRGRRGGAACGRRRWESLRRLHREGRRGALAQGRRGRLAGRASGAPSLAGGGGQPGAAIGDASDGSDGASGADGPRAAPELETLALEVPARPELDALGVRPATILVGYVARGRPAERAGLRANDLVLAVDGEPVGSFESFVSLVQTSGGRELEITYSRDVVRRRGSPPRRRPSPGPTTSRAWRKVFQIGASGRRSLRCRARARCCACATPSSPCRARSR
ncbi:MAG: site-2 protease family protein [Myxococcota bacterium]